MGSYIYNNKNNSNIKQINKVEYKLLFLRLFSCYKKLFKKKKQKNQFIFNIIKILYHDIKMMIIITFKYSYINLRFTAILRNIYDYI
jgi:hypothetical protein